MNIMNNNNCETESFVFIGGFKLSHDEVKQSTEKFLSDAAMAASGYSQLGWELLAMLAKGHFRNGGTYLNWNYMVDFMDERFQWSKEVYLEEREEAKETMERIFAVAVECDSQRDLDWMRVFRYQFDNNFCAPNWNRCKINQW